MQITIKTIDGKKNCNIEVDDWFSVLDIKKIIEDELNVPIQEQRLYYAGKQLENKKKLQSYSNDDMFVLLRYNKLVF